MRLVIASMLSGLLLLGAPYAGLWFDQADLILPMQIMALSVFFVSLRSTAIFLQQRELNMRPTVYHTMVRELVRLTVGLTLAFTVGTVWPLVFSQIAGSLAGMISSHI